MKRTLLLVLGLIIGSALFPVVVSAHQSGCHRWHSCPSDTGSYVCGDLGYYSECGGTTTYYQDPDYAGQGNDNGQAKADTDSTYIKSTAESDADKQGYDDGLQGNSDDPSPDASQTCDKTFTYSSPQPQEYVDAFHDSYLDACTTTYKEAYNGAYESAYQRGVDAKQAQDEASSQSIEAANTSNNSGLWWLAGLGAVGATAALRARKKR